MRFIAGPIWVLAVGLASTGGKVLDPPKMRASCFTECSTIWSSAYTKEPMDLTLNRGVMRKCAAKEPALRETRRQFGLSGAGVLCMATKRPLDKCCNCTKSP